MTKYLKYINNKSSIEDIENLIDIYLETVLLDFQFIHKKCTDKCFASENYLSALKDIKITKKGLEKTKLSNKEIIDLSKEDILRFNDSISESKGDIQKYNNPNFKLIMEYYKNLSTDEYAFKNLREYVSSMYTEDGVLRKNYKI